MRNLIALSLSTLLTLSSLYGAKAYSDGYPYHDTWTSGNTDYNWDSHSGSEDWSSESHEDGYNWWEHEESSEELHNEYTESQENAYDMVDELDELYQDMEEESSEYPFTVRPLESVFDKIEESIRMIVEGLEDAENGQKDSCNQKLREGVALLEKAIHQFEVRECRTAGIYKKRCIPQEMVELYKEDMLVMLEQLKEFLLADDNQDRSADMCSWQDFLNNLEDEYPEEGNWEEDNWEYHPE